MHHFRLTGPARFAHLIANIAPSLRSFPKNAENAVFIYRLQFAVRFAEFHYRRLQGDLQNAAVDLVSMLRDDIAPKSWWAVVLWDAVELLQNGKQTTSLHVKLVSSLQSLISLCIFLPFSPPAVLCTGQVMLFTSEEACLLIRKLDEICSRAQNPGSDYLSVVARATKSRDEKHALQKLQIVRLALAKYYARCSVIGVGGRT